MKKIKLILVPLFLVVLLSFIIEKNFQYNKIDIGSSVIQFQIIDNLGQVRIGNFAPPEWGIRFGRTDLMNSKFDVTINVRSINTNSQMRDKALLSAHFFDAANYPAISFVSKSIEETSSGYDVTGFLTIKNVTKEITIPFNFTENKCHAFIESNFSINRLDYNVGVRNETTANAVKVHCKMSLLKRSEKFAKN
jgi:polyisoprenoid-binding protein YceI